MSSSSNDDPQEDFLPLFVADLAQDMKKTHDNSKIIFQSEEEERAFFMEQNKPKPLKVCSIRELMQIKLPQKEYLLYPIIGYKSLSMLFASRGIGKTFLALYIAYAIASGSDFLKWKAGDPKKVLYIDGEMPAQAIQERLAHIIEHFDKEAPNGYFNIINPDLQDDEVYMPNIATIEGQERIEEHLEGVGFVVIDNLATLARHGRANDEESFAPVQEWILMLRRRGIAVLLVHHASKSGSQRGTSSKEDVLDTVIQLTRPKDYETEQGARFEVHYTKSRGFMGEDAEPFEAQLNSVNGEMLWTVKKLEDVIIIVTFLTC